MQTNKIISIKRRINPTDEQIHFIRHNSNKRRYIWNKLVEESKKYNHYIEFVVHNHLNHMAQLLGKTDIDNVKTRVSNGDDASLYCADVIKATTIDMINATKTMLAKDKKSGTVSTFNFRQKDPFRCAFKVRTCNEISKKSGNMKGKVRFYDTSHFEFRASYNYVKNYFNIELMEPICDEIDFDKYKFTSYKGKYSSKKRCSFHHDDIKEIVFMEELGKFYIILIVNMTYYIDDDEYESRKPLAGIDLGIRNPVTLYDGTRHMQFGLSSSDIQKIHRLMVRIGNLHSIMDTKKSINIARNSKNPNIEIHSKNYMKTRYKFRKLWKRVENIRREWRIRLAHEIGNSYQNIVVDTFTIPTRFGPNVTDKIKRRINTYNRQHAIYLFSEYLSHVSIACGCTFIKSPDNTTRQCSKCGHINQPLLLSERFLHCKKCGIKIDRDYNASINCYNFYKNNIC